MSMAGTEREPESTAPDVSVVTGLIRSGKSSMPKSTITTERSFVVALVGVRFACSAGRRGVKTEEHIGILFDTDLNHCQILYKNGRTDDRLYNNSCAWP